MRDCMLSAKAVASKLVPSLWLNTAMEAKKERFRQNVLDFNKLLEAIFHNLCQSRSFPGKSGKNIKPGHEFCMSH